MKILQINYNFYEKESTTIYVYERNVNLELNALHMRHKFHFWQKTTTCLLLTSNYYQKLFLQTTPESFSIWAIKFSGSLTSVCKMRNPREQQRVWMPASARENQRRGIIQYLCVAIRERERRRGESADERADCGWRIGAEHDNWSSGGGGGGRWLSSLPVLPPPPTAACVRALCRSRSAQHLRAPQASPATPDAHGASVAATRGFRREFAKDAPMRVSPRTLIVREVNVRLAQLSFANNSYVSPGFCAWIFDRNFYSAAFFVGF